MGICPLYIGWGKDGAMWVASELKALAADCVRFEEFPPGFVYTSWNDTRTQWYKPKYYVDNYIPTKTVDLTELRHQFEAAVVRQLMCDVPYGVLLSGGEYMYWTDGVVAVYFIPVRLVLIDSATKLDCFVDYQFVSTHREHNIICIDSDCACARPGLIPGFQYRLPARCQAC